MTISALIFLIFYIGVSLSITLEATTNRSTWRIYFYVALVFADIPLFLLGNLLAYTVFLICFMAAHLMLEFKQIVKHAPSRIVLIHTFALVIPLMSFYLFQALK